MVPIDLAPLILGRAFSIRLFVIIDWSRNNIVRQEPADVDPDRWTDEGELTELPEIPVLEGERVFREMCMDPVKPKIIAVLDLEIPMILDDPEEMAVRERIHKRIKAEIS